MSQPIKLNSKYIILLAMIFVAASLAADSVAYKIIGIGSILEPGATIVFPLTYLIGNIVTEVYGYDAARKFIWYGLVAEIVYALFVKGVLLLPSPTFWHFQNDYNVVFGSLLRFVMAGLIGDITSSFLNAYLISKWKIFTKGKYFWLRSICATAISEFSLVVLTAYVAFVGKVPFSIMLNMFLSAYGLELVYALLFVFPGYLIVLFLKYSEKIDVFDYDVNYNPFKF
jgi:uncharacterized integral membrane protein (TIGR00697 family)